MKSLPIPIAARFRGDRFGTSHALDALIGVLDIAVERLPVEDDPGGVLVLVRPPADLDHGLHVSDDKLRVLVGHDVGAGDDRGELAICSVQSG